MATIFDLSRDDFFFALDELGLPPEQRDELIRQYRSQNSLFAPLNRAADERQAAIAGEGRRPAAGGFLSKPEGATGMDALRGLRLEPISGLLGMLTGAGRAIDAPAAAAQGLIPESDMVEEALGTAGLAMTGGSALTRPVGSVGVGGRIADGLPEPRNAAERTARDILDLRAAGRASEVTDEMRARADPQYMFDNTPLPMDEASRLERARNFFPQDVYHSTGSTFSEFIPSAVGRHGMGVYTGKNRLDVESFLPRDDVTKAFEPGAQTLPLRIPEDSAFASEMKWQDALPDRWAYGDPRDVQDAIAGYASAADVLSQSGYKGVVQPATDWDGRVVFDPRNVRSRFALFDPEFAHLSNLNAANASPLLGLFAMMAAEEQRNGQ